MSDQYKPGPRQCRPAMARRKCAERPACSCRPAEIAPGVLTVNQHAELVDIWRELGDLRDRISRLLACAPTSVEACEPHAYCERCGHGKCTVCGGHCE